MGKSSRKKARAAEAEATTPGEVGPRQPCPCGSGRRYKSCHGDPSGPPVAFSARPLMRAHITLPFSEPSVPRPEMWMNDIPGFSSSNVVAKANGVS